MLSTHLQSTEVCCSCYSPRSRHQQAPAPTNTSNGCHFAYKRVSRTCRTSLFLGDSQVTSVFWTALVQPTEQPKPLKSSRVWIVLPPLPLSVLVFSCERFPKLTTAPAAADRQQQQQQQERRPTSSRVIKEANLSWFWALASASRNCARQRSKQCKWSFDSERKDKTTAAAQSWSQLECFLT